MSDINTPEITDSVRDALRLAGDRTLSQVKKSGAFLFKMKNTGADIKKEFFDIYVFLLSEKSKAETAMQVVAGRNFKIKPEEKQLSYEEITDLEEKAREFIKWCEQIAEDDNPIPEDYRHLARLTDKGQVALEYQAIAEHLLSMFKIVSYVGGIEEGTDGDAKTSPDLYVYDSSTGIYEKDIAALKNEIDRISNEVSYKGSIVTATREILHYVSYADPQKVYPFNSGKNLIPVLNGVLQLNFDGKEHAIVPHDPENKFTYLVPVRYDPDADYEPIDKILKEYVHSEDLHILYQITAQTLLQGFCDCGTLRTAYLIQGPARGGKSTFCDMLVKHFFSPRFVANETLQDLCGGSRFATYALPGKFLNLYDDLDDLGTLHDIGKFKNLIGSYNQSVEKKGVQRRVEKISCVHVFTCNRPPLLENKRMKTDRAWWERWNYIRFLDNEFKSDLTFQERNFTPENMSGFLNRVLEYVVLIKNDISTFKKQSFEDVLSFWDVASDPMSSFVSDCFFESTGRTEKYDKEGMLKAYKEYCKVQGIDDIHGIDTVPKLSRHLIDEGFSTSGRGKEREYLYQASKGWQGPAEIPNPTHKDDRAQTGIL